MPKNLLEIPLYRDHSMSCHDCFHLKILCPVLMGQPCAASFNGLHTSQSSDHTALHCLPYIGMRSLQWYNFAYHRTTPWGPWQHVLWEECPVWRFPILGDAEMKIARLGRCSLGEPYSYYPLSQSVTSSSPFKKVRTLPCIRVSYCYITAHL